MQQCVKHTLPEGQEVELYYTLFPKEIRTSSYPGSEAHISLDDVRIISGRLRYSMSDRDIEKYRESFLETIIDYEEGHGGEGCDR